MPKSSASMYITLGGLIDFFDSAIEPNKKNGEIIIPDDRIIPFESKFNFIIKKQGYSLNYNKSTLFKELIGCNFYANKL